MDSSLYVITARGGSKGLPGKNIKLLNGKPLINYTIEAARHIACDDDILVSTDSEEIKSIVEGIGLRVPFYRPAHLASDCAGSHEVLLHAVGEMQKIRRFYKKVVLLQPTSPFRTGRHIAEAMSLFDDSCDMVASVKKIKDNIYFNQFFQDEEGMLNACSGKMSERRQDCDTVLAYNGSIYVMRVADIQKTHMHELKRVRGYLMSDYSSLDIDTHLDWIVAESCIQSNLIRF